MGALRDQDSTFLNIKSQCTNMHWPDTIPYINDHGSSYQNFLLESDQCIYTTSQYSTYLFT